MRLSSRPVETFFQTWTPEMAYVLGYFAADGYMYRNPRGSHYVGFVSTDEELVRLVRSLIGTLNSIEVYRPKNKNWKTRYTLQVGSRKIFETLSDLGFSPAKSLTVSFPLVPLSVLSHFVRGYFDGDGCLSFGTYARKNRKSKAQVLFARFISGSEYFLKGLQSALLLGEIGPGSLGHHGKNFRLQYGMHDSFRLYKLMYPTYAVPCLLRKREKFERGLVVMSGPVV
ncbi:MAG: putative DOD family homing endonuclease [Parcubacteria group bacterium Gr01-1014_38]|nr:MAG: putative DOD family homing endonuclease [Parcubacteria group bacterium Gr01-1014_38]